MPTRKRWWRSARRAEAELKEIEPVVRSRPPDLILANALQQRSFLFTNQNQATKAIAPATEAAAIARRIIGENDPEYIGILLAQVRAQYLADDCEHALPEVDRALPRMPAIFGSPLHPLITAFRGVRARCLKDLNRLDEASEEFERTDSAVRADYGADSRDYATQLLEHGAAERFRGNSARAEDLVTNAIQILEARGTHGRTLATAWGHEMLILLQSRRLQAGQAKASQYFAATEDMEPNSYEAVRSRFFQPLFTLLSSGEMRDSLSKMTALARKDPANFQPALLANLGWARLLAAVPMPRDEQQWLRADEALRIAHELLIKIAPFSTRNVQTSRRRTKTQPDRSMSQ